MRTDDLNIFLAVARERHFGRAALALGISQPSVSRRLRTLETALGVELFVRTSRQVQLTPAGQVLLEDAPPLLERQQAALRRVQEAAVGSRGCVRVAAVPGAMAAFLPHVIRSHHRAHPAVTVSLHELLAHDQVDQLQRRELDVGFLRGTEIPRGDLRIEPLHEELMCVAVPGTHPLAGAPTASIESLRGEPLILPPRHLSPSTYDRIVAACRRAGFEPRVVQEASTASAMLGLVSAEVGVAVLAEDFHTLINPHVRLVPLEGFPITLSMLWRVDAPPLVSTLLESARAVSANRSPPHFGERTPG